MVTLRNGSQVPQVTLISVYMNIEAAAQENFMALFDLVEKCKDAGYKFVTNPFGDSKAILKAHALIDENENVHDDIKTIVLNSVEGSGMSLKLVNPLQSKQISKM